MNRKTMYLSAMALTLGLPFSVTWAQSPTNSLPAEILACADEKEVIQRLSCYDREVAAARAQAETPVAPPIIAETPAPAAKPVPAAPAMPMNDVAVPAPVEAAPVAAAVAEMAVATVAPAPTDNKPVAPAPQSMSKEDEFGYDRPMEEITAAVVAIRERPYGELVISLDNGQVWEQKHVDRRFKLDIGETVTVRKGPVAGYRLSGDGNRSIQVQRIN